MKIPSEQEAAKLCLALSKKYPTHNVQFGFAPGKIRLTAWPAQEGAVKYRTDYLDSFEAAKKALVAQLKG